MKAPLANYTVAENVVNNPEIKGVVSHMSKIHIAAMFLLLLTTKLTKSKSWKCHIQRLLVLLLLTTKLTKSKSWKCHIQRLF